MSKSNYKPVSLLPIPSKSLEKLFSSQLSEYFDKIFDDFLCAFRKGHGCQTTLLRLLEDWKYALDNNEYVAATFLDLPKLLIAYHIPFFYGNYHHMVSQKMLQN